MGAILGIIFAANMYWCFGPSKAENPKLTPISNKILVLPYLLIGYPIQALYCYAYGQPDFVKSFS